MAAPSKTSHFPQRGKNKAKARQRDQLAEELAAHIKKSNNSDEPAPVFFLLEKYPEAFRAVVKQRGGDIVAAAREFGVEKLFSFDKEEIGLQLCVMYNILPETDYDGDKYHVHHHVRYKHLDKHGHPKQMKATKKDAAAIEKKKRELDEEQEELDRLKKLKKKGRQARDDLREQSNKIYALQKQLKKLQGDAAREYEPNSHIYKAYDYSMNGECKTLNKIAIAEAVSFRTKCLRDAEHILTAVRKKRPDEKPHDKSAEQRGKEIVQWEEDKGERQFYGFKLFWKKDADAEADADAEVEDDDEEEKEAKGMAVWTHTKEKEKVSHPFEFYPAMTRSNSEEEAVKKYLSRSKSRDWTPYRNRTMDTD